MVAHLRHVVGLLLIGAGALLLAAAGGIVTTVGLILAYQYSTDHWTSWAYAWALIAPTSVGASMFLWGILHGRGDVVRQGVSALGVGLVLFIVGFAFFEGVLHLGGERGLAPLGRQALPIALIAAGVLVVLTRLWPRRGPERVADTDWPPQSGAPWSSGPTTGGPLPPPASEAFSAPAKDES